jgi:hypothetical protein
VQKEVGAQPVAAVVRQPWFARASPVQTNQPLQGEHQLTVQRAEDVLMAVAWCATKDTGSDMENLTKAELDGELN